MNNADSPKYIQLKEYIKQLIENKELKPGEKIYSENEFASKFEISRHTVRQSIGELVNEGWLYRMQGKGTFVARTPGAKKGSSKIIGVITTYLSDYIFPDIIKGIDSVLSSKGYSIILGHTSNETQNERDCLINMLDKNIDGLIVEPTKSALPNPNLDLYRELSTKGIPIIFIHGYYNDLNFSYIIEDDVLGGYLASKHLIELGHKKILGIFKVDDVQGHGRYKGYVKCMKEKDVKVEDSSVIWFANEDKDRMFEETNFVEKFISKLQDYSAIICYNDQIAVKVINILRRNNIKIPKNVSIISFDDSDICEITEVKLSSVAHPKDELGRKTAESLLELLENKKIHIEEVMKPELIVRESTKSLL